MSQEKTENTEKAGAPTSARRQKEAQALRDNLARRKAQSRARATAPDTDKKEGEP